MRKDTLTAEFIAEKTGGRIVRNGNGTVHGFCIDSRNIESGNLFAAIKGEKTDGHNYIVKALENGAGGILCSELPEEAKKTEGSWFAVECGDVQRALGVLAGAYLDRFDITKVGVTGSVGKTTTRALISCVLNEKFSVLSTSGNFNNELGVPITVSGVTDETEVGVFEMGTGVPGDIGYLADIVRPDIAVITNIGTCHIEFFGTREKIRDEKLDIGRNFGENGIYILNGDEPLLEGRGGVYCGIRNEKSDYFAENIRLTENGTRFDIKGRAKDVFVPAYGSHIVLDALYAFAAGEKCGMNAEEIKRGIAVYAPVGNRQKIEEKDGVRYILDFYNASPESIAASSEVCGKLAGGRSILVIGSVLELGDKSEELHRGIWKKIKPYCDVLVCFGKDAGFIADEAVKDGFGDNVFVFEDISKPDLPAALLKDMIKTGDCLLFKASHGIDIGRIYGLL